MQRGKKVVQSVRLKRSHVLDKVVFDTYKQIL